MAVLSPGGMLVPLLRCEALAVPSPSSVSIEIFDPSDTATLELLRDCRRTAFDSTKQNWLNSEVDFRDATNAASGKNLCAVAVCESTKTVVGSADLTPRGKASNYRSVIANVFVRPDRRGEGIGRRLLSEGIEGVLVAALPEANRPEGSAVLSLEVYTQNTPALSLYRNLGYEPSSPIHAGSLALADALGSNLVVSLSKTVPVPDN